MEHRNPIAMHTTGRARKSARERPHGLAGAKATERLRDIKQRLRTLAEDVLAGRVNRADAIAVNQCLTTLLRALETERTWELEERERRASEEGEDSLGDLADDEWLAPISRVGASKC